MQWVCLAYNAGDGEEEKIGCESHSQAGLASPHHQLPRVVSFSRIIIDMLQSYMIWLVSVRSQEFLGVKAFRSPLQW